MLLLLLPFSTAVTRLMLCKHSPGAASLCFAKQLPDTCFGTVADYNPLLVLVLLMLVSQGSLPASTVLSLHVSELSTTATRTCCGTLAEYNPAAAAAATVHVGVVGSRRASTELLLHFDVLLKAATRTCCGAC